MSLDLHTFRQLLAAVFMDFPASSFKCDLAANKARQIFVGAGFSADIVRLQNREIVPGVRGQYMVALDKNGQQMVVGETGFHETVRINGVSYIDAIVYEHFGVQALEWEDYAKLWLYPDQLEITGMR